MKRFLLFFTIVLTCLSLLAANAEAKRFGGGGSIGKQRSMSQEQVQRPPAAAPQPPGQPQPAGNKWLGPLAGLAAGVGLGALFAHGGFGSVLMVILLVVAVVFALSLFRKQQTAPQQPRYAGAGAPYSQPEAAPPPFTGTGGSTAAGTDTASNIPPDFPVEAFIRSAKTSFIRLQAANDRKDLNDIREYTTPEIFAEISMQLSERGDAPQKTDVLSLDATLLEVVTEGDYAIASVRFIGQLSENGGMPEAVDEIWHVQKHLHDDKAVWLLAGIQQTPVR